jgi:hypothetical protein
VPCHTDLEKRFADFLDSTADVVRYVKNERFGFSVTYYEGNRSQQYYPDFIVTAQSKADKETTWVAETKGEIRSNTPLKTQAAVLWCEKMSTTQYGDWRYLFVPQREFDKARGYSKSLAELADQLTPGTTALATAAAS